MRPTLLPLAMVQRLRVCLLAWLIFGPTLAAAAPCVVSGTDATFERVRYGKDEFEELGVNGMPAALVVPARRMGWAHGVFRGAVGFSGRVYNPWYTVMKPLTLLSGMLQLKPGAQVVNVYGDARGVHGDIVVWSDDVLRGEDKEPDEVLRDVALPCDALSLDDVDAPEDADADADAGLENTTSTEEEPPWWGPRAGDTNAHRLYAAPRFDAPSVRYMAPHSEGKVYRPALELEEVGRVRGWVRLRIGAVTDFAGQFVGWAPRAELVRMPWGGSRSAGCHGQHFRYSEGGRGSSGVVLTGEVTVDSGLVLDGWATTRGPGGYEIEVDGAEPPNTQTCAVIGIAGLNLRFRSLEVPCEAVHYTAPTLRPEGRSLPSAASKSPAP